MRALTAKGLQCDTPATDQDNKHLLWELWKAEGHPNHTRATNNGYKHFPYSFVIICNSSTSQLLQRNECTTPPLAISSTNYITKHTTDVFLLLVFIMFIMPERPVIGRQGACSGWQCWWEIALLCSRGSCWWHLTTATKHDSGRGRERTQWALQHIGLLFRQRSCRMLWSLTSR